MYSYNLFRSTKPDGLSCAVPEQRSVPAFRRRPHWRSKGALEPTGRMPRSDSTGRPQEGVRFNGFYLFATFQKDRSGA